jgi:hypothetical protein
MRWFKKRRKQLSAETFAEQVIQVALGAFVLPELAPKLGMTLTQAEDGSPSALQDELYIFCVALALQACFRAFWSKGQDVTPALEAFRLRELAARERWEIAQGGGQSTARCAGSLTRPTEEQVRAIEFERLLVKRCGEYAELLNCDLSELDDEKAPRPPFLFRHLIPALFRNAMGVEFPDKLIEMTSVSLYLAVTWGLLVEAMTEFADEVELTRSA